MASDDSSDKPENGPAKVKNVFIDGLARTRDDLITNQLERLFKVKTFNELMKETNSCKLKLERLGIFKSIDVLIDVSDSNNTDDFDVYYKVRELNRFNANVGTSAGNMEGHVSTGAKVNNLWGHGESFMAQASYGTKTTSSYDFSVSKPSVGNSDRRFKLHAMKSTTDMTPSYFREHMRGLGVDFSVPGPFGIHTLGWDFFWRENTLLPSAPFEVREHCGHSLKSALRNTLLSDGRDDWIFPSKGHLLKHNIEYCGVGGDVQAVKTDLELQFNKELLSGIVLAGSIHIGGLHPLSSSVPLINDRYFLGGPLSVRGYATRGIGQHAELASLGGDLFWESGLHIFTPLPYRPNMGGFGELFRMHFFANAGNLTNAKDLDMKDFIYNPRFSYGFGIMIIMGGSFRLELNY